jgi:polyketide-type polyunsaturated fatty acid synthase PfaA
MVDQITGEKNEATGNVAIVGMACRFPKAKDVRQFWQNVCNRLDAIVEVPPERWRIEDFYCEDRLAPDRVYSKWGGFLDDAIFDPVKWHIPPASLRHIEPMQLLSLDVAWQALVDAGYDRRAFPRQRAGVLFAVSGSHEWGAAYCFRTLMRQYLPKVEGLTPEMRERIYASLETQLPEWSEDSFPGFLGNVIAGRIAREFDFQGPNFTVDAACAGSLAALFTAVQQLRAGTSDLVLVGGADGTNNPFGFMSFAKTHALSPRGRSRAFDDSADGIALGEGIACILLKRLRDAERDGDKIYAVIKGIGSSSDGKNRSLTAPHPPGQALAVTRAYEDAQCSPASVTLIEAHGTGTAVGDSAELTTLSEAFDKHTARRQYVAVGSVKSMIGHTKTVAGLASVIKAVLALEHRVLPPTLGIDKPTTRVDWEQSPFYLNTETRPWIDESCTQPRRAGVSSFGFGGTNFHVVLEEHSRGGNSGNVQSGMPRAAELLAIQRGSREEILSALRRLEEQLATVETDDLAGVAAAIHFDESMRTESIGCRLAFVAESMADLRRNVQNALALLPDRSEWSDPRGTYYSESTPVPASAVCFLYPGQGSQSVNMLRDLVVASAWSHELFGETNDLVRDALPQALSRYVFPPPVFDEGEGERQTLALKDTRVAQPALGVVELFATDLLARFGVRPALAAGHSYGELVALHVAGCLSRMDLLRLSAYRGRVCAEAASQCPGAMASVQAGKTATEAALAELSIAAELANLNAPDQTVIAGSETAIGAAVEQLTKRGLRARKVPVSAAFHTGQLRAASEAMRTYLADVVLQPPCLPVYSNTTGQRHDEQPESIRSLLSRHLSEPVLFDKEIRQLHADGARVFVEVGPGKVLTDLVSRILKGEAVTALALDVPGREGWTHLAHLLARLAVLGLPVRLAAWFEGRELAATSLAEFLARTCIENTPKPSDWILAPNKAEPVTPLPQRKPKEIGTPTRNGSPAKNGQATPAIPSVVNRDESIHPIDPLKVTMQKVPAMTTTNGEASRNGERVSIASAPSDLFAQFQETTRLLLEAQQTQNRVLERYLETQERLLLHCTEGPVAKTVKEVSPATPIAPAPVRPPVAIPANPAGSVPRLAVAPPPVPRRETVAISPSASSGIVSAAKSRTVETSHVPAVDSDNASAEVPPPTETFRQDLLEVVSARTGYPIETLDEELALEAGLGIDSIKTVEIFSNLKTYHPFFRAEDQEEEELLVEFTKLKTLRDIILSYDRHRQAYLASPKKNGVPKSDTNGVNGAANRYSVLAAPVPMETNGLKKNACRTVTPFS